jgi:hypothetical protein
MAPHVGHCLTGGMTTPMHKSNGLQKTLKQTLSLNIVVDNPTRKVVDRSCVDTRKAVETNSNSLYYMQLRSLWASTCDMHMIIPYM